MSRDLHVGIIIGIITPAAMVVNPCNLDRDGKKDDYIFRGYYDPVAPVWIQDGWGTNVCMN